MTLRGERILEIKKFLCAIHEGFDVTSWLPWDDGGYVWPFLFVASFSAVDCSITSESLPFLVNGTGTENGGENGSVIPFLS